MNKRLQGIIIGIIIGVMISGVVTLAKNGTEAIEAWYSDIKICVNGEYITPTDANGNEVEPFIVNGTTYLPVRAVGNALDMEVDWDDTAKTVFLAEKPKTVDNQTDSEPAINKYLSKENLFEGLKKEGITVDPYLEDDSLVYLCTLEVSLFDEEFEPANTYIEESLSGFDSSVDSIFKEIPEINSVVIIFKDANGTLIYKNEFTR